eukprot:8985185-Lingulodinium_polyedra.AAC.1
MSVAEAESGSSHRLFEWGPLLGGTCASAGAASFARQPPHGSFGQSGSVPTPPGPGLGPAQAGGGSRRCRSAGLARPAAPSVR